MMTLPEDVTLDSISSSWPSMPTEATPKVVPASKDIDVEEVVKNLLPMLLIFPCESAGTKITKMRPGSTAKKSVG